MTNHKHTKRALLSSMVSLVLCFAMLLGTTFAWFTDTASTSVNKIQAGTLKVDIVDTDGTSLQDSALNFKDVNDNTDILWEPGVTFNTDKFQIKNNGNLALKYQIILNGVNGNADLLNVIDFKVVKADGTTVDLDNLEGYLTSDETSEAYYITATMKKEAGNGYQGQTLEGIGITVVAAQWTYEFDSNGNDYDQDAAYSSVKNPDFKRALLITSGDHTINQNLTIDDEGKYSVETIRVTGGTLTITGGNYSATGTYGSNSVVRADGGEVIIEDGTFTVGGDNNAIYTAGGNITIKGGTFKSESAFNGNWFTLNGQDHSGSTITVMGGKFYQFNPAKAGVEGSGNYVGKNEIVVADGYKVVQNGDWYEVVAENPIASETDLTALAANSTAVLMNDIVLSNTVTLADNVTILGNGNTISGAPVHTNGNLVVKDVVFDAPTNSSNNASNVVVNSSSATFDGCTFKNTQWDSIQVAGNLDGKEVVINNCSFSTTNAAARFIHVESDKSPSKPSDVRITITNNDFGSAETLTNDTIGLYFVKLDNIDFGGNNVFDQIGNGVWICSENGTQVIDSSYAIERFAWRK